MPTSLGAGSRLPSVSVVIPTHDRRDGLPAVLDAVARDPWPLEVLVVVDGCDDGSMELVEERGRSEPRVRAVWRENGGEGAARQTGVEAARGDVVLLLDDDVLAGPGLAAGHAAVHARVDRAVVLGYMPTRLPSRREPGQFATVLYAQEYEAQCREYEADPSSVLRHLWAGNLSLPREDALRVRLDGPRLRYHDDQLFGLRCLAAGLAGVFDRALVAEHSHSRDLDSFLRQARQAGRARRALVETHPGLRLAVDPRDELPPVVRELVVAASRRPLEPLAHRVLRAVLRTAGAGRVWAAELAAARLLRHLELLQGFQEPREGAGDLR